MCLLPLFEKKYITTAADIRLRRVDAASLTTRLRRLFSTGATVNLLGMALCIVSAEQVVGLLIARGLSTYGLQGTVTAFPQYGATALQGIRPLDVFVIQVPLSMPTSTLLAPEHLLDMQ